MTPLQGYENPEKFDPERFGPERGEDIKFATNFLVFGHGPHYCVGKEYAQNHLATFLARISTSLDWKRTRSEVRSELRGRRCPANVCGGRVTGVTGQCSIFNVTWAWLTACVPLLLVCAGERHHHLPSHALPR